VTPEEEEGVIKKAYEFISKHGLEEAALLILYSVKPMAPLGGALGRFFLGPLIPFIGHREETIITAFEQPENIEKLIQMIETKRREDKERKKEEQRRAAEKKGPKTGFRRFWPF